MANSYLQKFIEPLKKQFPDKEFVYQQDNTGVFERIMYNKQTIIETIWNYTNSTDKKIDTNSGIICVYFDTTGNDMDSPCYKYGRLYNRRS